MSAGWVAAAIVLWIGAFAAGIVTLAATAETRLPLSWRELSLPAGLASVTLTLGLLGAVCIGLAS